MNGILQTLLQRNNADKTNKHSYGPLYEEWFDPFRFIPHLRILEIGVFQGGSLRAWRDYFPDAWVYGVDNDPAVLFQEPRITCLYGDAFIPSTIVRALGKLAERESFHIIIDDGPHYAIQQLGCMFSLWPMLRPGGLYIVEDALDAFRTAALRGLPYGREYDRRGVSGVEDDILYKFQKPGSY